MKKGNPGPGSSGWSGSEDDVYPRSGNHVSKTAAPAAVPGAAPPSPDEAQEQVITARASARQIVEAGPGCGKTHVACARVASLLDDGEVPDTLLLLSFTRTAVHELRTRIATMASKGTAGARGVEIRTLDSLAWRLATSSRETGPISSHDASISAALEALRRAAHGEEPELAGYLRRFSHVLVDEAQDLVGNRALMVIELLNSLHGAAGWTVFLDPAQAIYGWSSDASDEAGGQLFLGMLGRLEGKVTKARLSRVYRTSERSLLRLMTRAREAVLGARTGERLDRMRRILEKEAGDDVHALDSVGNLVAELGPTSTRALLLYRRRVDALFALSYLKSAGQDCRLRLGGMPRVAAPWIAVVANELASRARSLRSVTRAEFDAAWLVVCHGRWIARDWTPSDAWNLLIRMAASGKQLDMTQVANQLACSVVPDEAFIRELGPGGPVVGTVHGSKGREADHVVFHLPHEAPRDDEADDVEADDVEASEDELNETSDEEARVMYVAVSRAVHTLLVKQSSSLRCGYHEDRAWRATRRGDLQVEIGRDGDVDAIWPMLMRKGADAAVVQARLANFPGKLTAVRVHSDKELNWTRCIELEDGSRVGALSRDCVDALGELMKRKNRKALPPLGVGHLTWLDVTTVAVHEGDPRAAQLARPWRETRLMLAPVVAGMGFIKRRR